MYLRKEMNYDVQTSKFKLKCMKHHVHAFFLSTIYTQKVVKSCETFLLSFFVHKMISYQNLEFFEQI